VARRGWALRSATEFVHASEGTAMEFDHTPGEGTDPIEYEPPRIIDVADVEAHLAPITN